jgi:hypothetical protein
MQNGHFTDMKELSQDFSNRDAGGIGNFLLLYKFSTRSIEPETLPIRAP